MKVNASPAWANDQAITELYKLAKRLQVLTGVQYHVDHIDPLQSDIVCGLHIATNLQVIPATLNYEKSNRFTPYRYCNGTRFELVGSEWQFCPINPV